MRSRRIERCDTCGLNALLCACARLPKFAPSVPVTIVAHRTERLKSTNTGRLAVHMLHGATLLNRAEGARGACVGHEDARAGAYVLFPSEEALPFKEAKARGLHSLIVPDGTWNQAKRMARRDPSCAGLPHVRLDASAQSRYQLRRNTRPDGLCTFEAVAEALRALDHQDIADAMLVAFEHWVFCATLVRAGAHESRTAHSLAATQES